MRKQHRLASGPVQNLMELCLFLYLLCFVFFTRRTTLQSEEIVSELVHTFLLPEVMRENVREKGRRNIICKHTLLLFNSDVGFQVYSTCQNKTILYTVGSGLPRFPKDRDFKPEKRIIGSYDHPVQSNLY